MTHMNIKYHTLKYTSIHSFSKALKIKRWGLNLNGFLIIFTTTTNPATTVKNNHH
jgi:hypothetical protein